MTPAIQHVPSPASASQRTRSSATIAATGRTSGLSAFMSSLRTSISRNPVGVVLTSQMFILLAAPLKQADLTSWTFFSSVTARTEPACAPRTLMARSMVSCSLPANSLEAGPGRYFR